MDHLKFAEKPMNKGIQQSNILTAQIYAQINSVFKELKFLHESYDLVSSEIFCFTS